MQYRNNSQIAVIVSEDSSPPTKNAIWENESLGNRMKASKSMRICWSFGVYNEYVKSHRNEVVREYLSCNIKEILVDNDMIEIIFKEENQCA